MAKLMRQIPWGIGMIFLLLLWLIFLLIALSFVRHEPDQQTNQRITQALRDLQYLHQQREEITKFLADYNSGLVLTSTDFIITSSFLRTIYLFIFVELMSLLVGGFSNISRKLSSLTDVPY